MTLLNVRNQIISSLCEKDILEPADFAKIKLTADLEGSRHELITAALEELKEAGMVKKAGEIWILSSPLNAQGQELHLSMPLCNEIADVINTYLSANEVDEQVDALNIHEGHIITLVQIISEILSEEDDE